MCEEQRGSTAETCASEQPQLKQPLQAEQLALLMAQSAPSATIIQESATRSNSLMAAELYTHGRKFVTLSE